MRSVPGPATWRKSAAVAVWAVAAAACATYHVRSDFDPEAGFTGLRSYAWVDSTRASRDSETSPFLERRVRRAVDRTLQARGFAPAADNPDFLVTAFVIEPAWSEARPRRGRWYAAPCAPAVSVFIGLRYPYGFSFRRPWYGHRGLYVPDPWGYACAYRLGIGYIWVPIYERPGDRMPGTLVVDILRPSDHELIWRGWAEGALLGPGGRDATQEELDEIVARVLAEFPPR